MNTEEIEARVKAIVIDEMEIDDPGRVTSDANLLNDLNADSLGIVELMMAIEEAFDIKIPENDCERLLTVGDVIEYIQSKTGAAQPG